MFSFPVFLGRWCYPVFPYIIFPLRIFTCSCSYYAHLDHQIHFYTIPSLDPYPTKPIRHAITFAVDDQHLKRLQPLLSASGMPLPPEPVDFCVVKRSSIAIFTMKDRLIYQKVWLKTKHSPCQLILFQEIPLPQGSPTITLARRTGKSLCIADKEYYSILDLEASSLFQVIPVSQSSEPTPFVVKPSITVISQNEFLLLSWTGASTLGLFITGDGDPVRGTLEWPSHPEAICAYTILNRTHCSDDSRIWNKHKKK